MTVSSAGGYVLFIRYKEICHEYLFVLMLNDRLGASVTKKLLVEDSLHLDMSKLYVAGRINITHWKDEIAKPVGHKYVSFIRGRRSISDYFIDFIGCTNITKPKEATNKIIDILNDYIRENEYEGDDKSRCHKIAGNYLKECVSENNREASLETLSLRLDEENPGQFFEFASNEKNQMDSLFKVDNPTLGRLFGVKFKQGGLAITMSEEYVKEHVTIKDGIMTVKDVPQKLQDEISALI